MEIDGLIKVDEISPRARNTRKSPFYFKTIPKKQLEEHENDGWKITPSKLQKSVRVQKPKPHNIAFEDKVWALFAKMGFDYINKDNYFKIEYQNSLKKQIDVFAADFEAIVILECKSSATRKPVSYQKDINELIGIKEKLRVAAKEMFPGQQKVSFIFATNNSIVSKPDRTRLKEDSIFLFDQDDLSYFEQLSEHLGSAAKYQLFGKLFESQKIPGLKTRIPAIKGKTVLGQTYYSFTIDPKYLLQIGFVLHRPKLTQRLLRPISG